MYDVIVIGGGPAGVTAALRACELGKKVALIERNRFGGTCTNDGCVPTRVLARAARLVREAEKFDHFGLITQQPKIDFPHLLSFARGVVEEIHEKKQIVKHLEEAGVNVIADAGSARFIDEHTVELENGQQLSADKFILCSGGHTRQVQFPGSEYTLSIQDIWTLDHLPKSIAIVGAAATGCQVASILSAFGVKVTLLEVSPRILRIEDPLVSIVLERVFEQRGIDVVAGIGGLDRVEKTDDGLQLIYKKGDQMVSLPVEAVLLAIGWVGNIEGLNLEAAKVQSERGYVTVNDFLQTTNPHIYAAGDINGKMMLVQSGSVEGKIAAENAVLGPGIKNSHVIVPHGGFTDPEYASVGLTEEEAIRNGLDYVAAVVPFADMDRAIIDREPEGFCKLIVNAENHRILGAHVVGEQAVEIVQLVAAGMSADMWVEHLAELELAYPTYTAIVGLTARKIVADLGVLPLAAEWRTLGKPVAAEWERSVSEMSSEIIETQSELAQQFAS